MKTRINCFIPFLDEAQVKETIQNLQQSELNLNIYLVSTQKKSDNKALGYPIIYVPTLTSTSAIQSIAEQANSDYTLLYTKYTTLELGYFALERMLKIADDSCAGMVYADHYQILGDRKSVV